MKCKQHVNPWFIASMIACVLFLLCQVIIVELSPWTGDYWEHRAVIKELSLQLLHPSHPILKVDAPHAFFSPYAVLLGAIISVTGISVAAMLNIATIVNLLLFFVAIYLLTRLFVDERSKHPQAFFLLLLMTFFFWGPHAPLYSSFFHFRSFVLILAYPSTFAFICSVFAATVSKKLLLATFSVARSVTLSILLSLLLCIIILTHPLTFVFASCLLLYVYLNISVQNNFNRRLFIKNTLLLVGPGILALILANVWPYYPLFALLSYVESGNQFHADSLELYQHVLWKIFPVLLLPFFIFFNRSISWKKDWPWMICFAVLLLIYGVGFYTKSYGMGRMIAFAVIFCHLLFIKKLVLIREAKAIWVTLIFVVTVPYLIQSKSTFRYLLTKSFQRVFDPTSFHQTKHPPKAHLFAFLEPLLEKKSPVVLTDLSTGLFIPAMGGRVVAAGSPVYWVPDAVERKKQVQHFFSSEANDADRAHLIALYKPDYILLTPATASLLPQLHTFIEPQSIARRNGVSLYRVLTTE